MDLAYYGIDVSQQDLANILRPYNNPQGYNDDKSVALEEFEPVVKNYRLIFYSRPNGTVNLVKSFLANDIPVLTRTWLKEDDYSQKSSAYIGHFRILTGFDDAAQEFIQMDSIEGSRRFSYSQFLRLWQPFNYEYAVIAPLEKEGAIRAILGPEESSQVAWSNAKQRAQDELKTNPQSLYSNFNLSVAYYSLGQYQDSVQTFSKIRQRLPIKMLWYQLEPVLAYQQTKDYPEVFTLTDQIFQSGNPAFAEAYIVRGDAYLAQENKEAARREYQKAYLYNQN
ncbi:MAG: C39 family peptidase, partial [Firmicutes bacterium]|nr:C39 family peptidase [Bacillota bacterium]